MEKDAHDEIKTLISCGVTREELVLLMLLKKRGIARGNYQSFKDALREASWCKPQKVKTNE